jgi:hypothetical protein
LSSESLESPMLAGTTTAAGIALEIITELGQETPDEVQWGSSLTDPVLLQRKPMTNSNIQVTICLFECPPSIK